MARGEPIRLASEPAVTTGAQRRKSREIIVAGLGAEELSMVKLQRLIAPQIKAQSETQKIDYQKAPAEYRKLRRALEERAVSEWLLNKALVHEARQAHLSVTQDDLNEALAELSHASGKIGVLTLAEAASNAGLSLDDFTETLTDALMSDKVVRKWVDEHVKEADLRNLYDQQAAEIAQTPRRRHYQYLLLMKKDGVDPDEQEKEMKKAYSRAKRGADFSDLAKQAGMEPGIPTDRWISESDSLPDARLRAAIWDTKPGEVSEVVTTRFGFHLVKVLEEKPAEKLTFEQCRPVLVGNLVAKLRRDLGANALKKLEKLTFVNTRYLTSVDEGDGNSGQDKALDAILDMREKKIREKEAGKRKNVHPVEIGK